MNLIKKTVSSVEDYLQALQNGEVVNVEGLCGRIIRGKKPEDFKTLTDDPTRLVVMPMDETGLETLLGKSGYEMLVAIGYEEDYIRHKVEDGNDFKLVIFPAGEDAKLATWGNVIEVVAEAYSDYPEVGQMLNAQGHSLKDLDHRNFDDFEEHVNLDCSEIDKDGSSNSNYMTLERFLDSDGSWEDCRLFLYFSVHLRELFAGDGWTRTKDGQKGVKEYLMPNKEISSLNGAKIIDIDIELPTLKNETMNTEVKIAEHMDLVYIPKFWDPKKAYQKYVPDIAAAYREGVEYAVKNKLKTAQRLMKDGISNAMALIDMEDDFRLSGRLPVVGTDDAVLKCCARMINGTVQDFYTGIFVSQDGHPQNHISFDTYWRKPNGTALNLGINEAPWGGPVKAATLTLADEKSAAFHCVDVVGNDLGYVRSAFDPYGAVEYWKELQDSGQGDIWVFAPHCILRTDGVNMHPLLVETIAFWSGARTAEPTMVFKGHISGTDWFGAFKPCVVDSNHPQGGFQKDVLDSFKEFNRVEIAGVAEDFCVYYTKQQVLDYLANTEYIAKLVFLIDGTAAIVPDAEHVKKQNEEAKDAGVKFIMSDTPFNQV